MDQQEEQASENEIIYHAVEKDGVVTAIWEMQGRKHMRTIDPRSEEGRHILGSHTVDEPGGEPAPSEGDEAAQQNEAAQ